MKLKLRGNKFWIHGTIGDKFLRLPLGTANKQAADDYRSRVEQALRQGRNSTEWPDLKKILPPRTFAALAEVGSYQEPKPEPEAPPLPTWADLCAVNELDMERRIANKLRGATPEEGIMSASTRDRYRQIIRHFTAFLGDGDTPLENIVGATIEKFKVARHKKITAMKQGRGGASIALDVAVLHRVFGLAIEKKLMAHKPIDLSKESKPGKNPKNGARPFTGEELAAIRQVAVYKTSRKETMDDTSTFLLLRWSGLRVSDAVQLQWKHVHFGRGSNGEIEILTQKRSKVAIIPLSTELRDNLESLYSDRKPSSEARVLWNPETGVPFANRAILSRRAIALCERAGIRGSAHCFRDTFACDMLTRGVGIFEVAKMLADTVETVEKCYAQFVPAARDAIQVRMDSGIGLEEQARLAQQRGRRIVAIRAAG